MSRWFRLYDDTINDPKVIKLPEVTRWHWVALLCVASKNDGQLPHLDDVAIQLRVTPAKATDIISTLVKANLIDKTETGFAPHNWNGRQYKTDSSVSRVQKYRDKRRAAGLPVLGDYSVFRPSLEARDGAECVYCLKDDVPLVVDHMDPICQGGTDDLENLALACKACNSGKSGRTPEQAKMFIKVTSARVSLERYRVRSRDVTVTVTPPETETETETETKKKEVAPSAVDLAFDEFWKAYPKRDGSNPKEPAAKLFRAAVKAGALASDIIAGARNCAVAEAKNIGTPYIPQAVKWLRDQRWKDYQTASTNQAASEIDWDAILTSYKRFGVWSKYAGPDLDSPGCRVPADMLAKHGLSRNQGQSIEAPRLKSMGGLN